MDPRRKPPLSRFPAALAALAAFCAFCGCERPAPPPPALQPDVILLQTGRLRGNVYPATMREGVPLQHYPKIAAFVRSVRQEAGAAGAKVVLVDLGDSLTGSFASFVTRSANMADFFNHLGYDAIALGNLDADADLAVLQRLKMPVLTPFRDAEGKPVPQGARNAAAFGPADLSVFAAANFYGGLDPAAAPHRFPAWFGAGQRGKPFPVREYEPLLAGGRNAALRLFTWMKFESPDAAPEPFLKTLRAGGVDLILAHRIYSGDIKDAWSSDSLIRWEPPVAENILRENRGFTICRTDLKRENGAWRVLSSRLVSANTIQAAPDSELAALIEKHRAAIEAADKPVATLPEPLDKPAILSLLLRCLATAGHADLVAYSPNSVRGELPGGPLKASRLFGVLPWTSPIATLALRPEEIERALAASPVAVLRKTDAAPDDNGFLHLVSGRFLAEVIRDALALPEERLSLMPDSSEFGFFAATLEQRFDELLAGPPPGWVTHSPATENSR